MITKDRLVRDLDRLGLARPAYRLYEYARAFPRERTRVAPDGLPYPPRRLRVLVSGTANATSFLHSGWLSAQTVAETFARHGMPVSPEAALLDFGCGCGRVARHWPLLGGPAVHGTDANEQLVSWCAENLPFGRFAANGPAPPLAFGDERFDAAYAVSVLTHLPDGPAEAWLAELARVLRPGGLLVLTVHGDRYRERMTPEERERYDAGLSVVRRESGAGTNLCTAFHPEAFVRERFTTHLDLVAHLPGGAGDGTQHHDLVVLRRPTDA